MQMYQFELAVAIPRDGRSVKIREYGRDGLTFIEGRRGQPYSIQFRNNSPNRVMAIVSVDGLDVVDGKPATAESRGYIVEGYANAEIKGWRTSTSEVRQFFFEDKQGTYAAGTVGDTSNCGVIAVKVFAEKPKPLPVYIPPTVVREEHHHHHYPHWHGPLWGSTVGSSGLDVKYTCNASSLDNATLKSCCGDPGPTGPQGPAGVSSDSVQAFFMSAEKNQAPEFNLGTGWGAALTDCVALTSFEKAHEMVSMCLYYTNTDALKKMGIVLEKEVAVMSLPQGFGGFCQPPKGIR